MRDSDLTEEQKQIKDEAISEMKKFQDVRTDDFPIDGLHFPLRSLSLENFKSVSQQDINFKPLSVIVGANSSGKSTLLQSILLLTQSTQTTSSPGNIRLNGNLTKLGRFQEVLNRQLNGQDSPFNELAKELISKDSKRRTIEKELSDLINDIDYFAHKAGEATHEDEYNQALIEREATVELLIKNNAELIRIFEESDEAIKSLNPDIDQIRITGELFFHNLLITSFKNEDFTKGKRSYLRRDLRAVFDVALMEASDDSQAQVYRSNFSFSDLSSNGILEKMDLSLKTTGRTAEDLNIPEGFLVRNKEALNAGFRRKQLDELLEVVGSIEAGQSQPRRTDGMNQFTESNFFIDVDEQSQDDFDPFFISASGFDGVFPNTILCSSERKNKPIEDLVNSITENVAPSEPRPPGQDILPYEASDPDSPIDYPNNWDEMDEIEQYAWLDNNGYGQDWTVYASQDPVHGFAKLVDEWDLWDIDLILKTGDYSVIINDRLNIPLDRIRQFIEDHGKQALIDAAHKIRKLDVATTLWEPLGQSLAFREFGNFPDQYSRFERALRETKRLFHQGVHYLGPLRDLVPSPGPEEAGLGTRGQHAPYVLHDLARTTRRYVVPSQEKIFDDGLSKLIGKSRKQRESPDTLNMSITLSRALNEWLEWFGFGISITTTENAREGIGLVVSDTNGEDHDITMVGVGISQAYPVILQCLLSRPGDLLLFEQPELHLHPALQKKMGQFLLYFARERRQIIIETHSEHIVNQLRATAAADPEDQVQRYVQLIFAEQSNGETKYTPSEINKYGGLDEDWPDGFLDESSKLSEKLLSNAIAKKKREIEPTD